MASHIVGDPCSDSKRELEFALESFRDGKITAEDFQKLASGLWPSIKHISSNTFSYTDLVLATTLGAVPPGYNFAGGESGFDTYFSMARGNASVPATEMTKWFDTKLVITMEGMQNEPFPVMPSGVTGPILCLESTRDSLLKIDTKWPSNPPGSKNILSCCMQVPQPGFKSVELTSESSGPDKDCLKDGLGEQGQHVALNYYPPRPQPEFTYELPGHTVPSNLTILLQALDVAGLQLQVLKDGKWLDVKPHPDALVIYIGDPIQALSSGEYESVIVNADKERLSMVTEGNGYSSRQANFAIAIPELIAFQQLKFQGNASPFESHPVLMIMALSSLLGYYLSNHFMIKISATRQPPGYTYNFLSCCTAFFGPLSMAALSSTLFPSSVYPFFFAISVLVSLSHVPPSVVTTLWNRLRGNFPRLHHWISGTAAVGTRPPV